LYSRPLNYASEEDLQESGRKETWKAYRGNRNASELVLVKEKYWAATWEVVKGELTELTKVGGKRPPRSRKRDSNTGVNVLFVGKGTPQKKFGLEGGEELVVGWATGCLLSAKRS